MGSNSPNKVEKGHQMYRDGQFREALIFYTGALSTAKTKPQKIALHSNRAACYLKLHHFKQAAEECTSVLELDHKHTGALMLRAQTLVTLKEYTSALFDVNRLIELNPSSEIYRTLEARLRTQLVLPSIPESEEELVEEEGIQTQPVPKKEETYKSNNSTPIIECKKVVSIDSFKVDKKSEQRRSLVSSEVVVNMTSSFKESSGSEKYQKPQSEPMVTVKADVDTLKEQINKISSEQQSQGWKTIPKPKGHSTLDYARWDQVGDDSSDEDDDDDEDDEDLQPQYRFRVKSVGVRPVK